MYTLCSTGKPRRGCSKKSDEPDRCKPQFVLEISRQLILPDLTPSPLLLFIHSKPPQILHIHPLQRPLIRRLKHNLRHLPIIHARPGLKSFSPATHAQAPFAAIRDSDLAQVVSARGGEVEELGCYDCCGCEWGEGGCRGGGMYRRLSGYLRPLWVLRSSRCA
jgi:hypothetical protein